MPISTLRNRVAQTVTGAPGTGTITLNAAVSSYQSFTDAYGANATVDILIEDGTAWELASDCTYDDTAGTITRGTLIESSTGAALNLTSSAVVYAGLSADALRTFVQDAIAEASSKTTPVDADEFGITDSAASGVLKRLSWANLKATSKTYTDTLYDSTGTAASAVTAHDTTSAHAGIVAAQTTAASSKATPVDADVIPLADSAASFALKKLTWANLKTTVQSALDALYKLLPSGTSGQTLYHNGTQWVASNTENLSFDGSTLRPKEIETTGTGGYFAAKNGSNYAAVMYGQNNYLALNSSYSFKWSSGNQAITGHDTYVWRTGVGALGLRNSLGVYPTYTDASNYERLTLTGTAGSNVQIKAETAGTGADNLDLLLTPAGTGKVKIDDAVDTSHALTIGADTNLYRSDADVLRTSDTFVADVAIGINTASPTAKLDVNSDIIRLRTAKTPASASATGNAGDICWDSGYVYVCVATDTWKRAALSTW